jgi:hypothetical protein
MVAKISDQHELEWAAMGEVAWPPDWPPRGQFRSSRLGGQRGARGASFASSDTPTTGSRPFPRRRYD